MHNTIKKNMTFNATTHLVHVLFFLLRLHRWFHGSIFFFSRLFGSFPLSASVTCVEHRHWLEGAGWERKQGIIACGI